MDIITIIIYIIMIVMIVMINSCIMGFVTYSISKSKGYESGFNWGFWLGILGVVVVACKPTIYANLISIEDEDWICPNCSQFNDGFESECVKCGLQKPIQPNETLDIDEILKLKKLLDAGAITQEEFNAKKKELLNL